MLMDGIADDFVPTFDRICIALQRQTHHSFRIARPGQSELLRERREISLPEIASVPGRCRLKKSAEMLNLLPKSFATFGLRWLTVMIRQGLDGRMSSGDCS